MKKYSPVRNLREFLSILRSEGELVEIEAPAASDQEIAEIHRRVAAANGPALLFKNVIQPDGSQSPFPVATNLFGSNKRVERAFGDRPLDFVKHVVALKEELMPPTPKKLIREIPFGLEALKVFPKKRRRGPAAEIIDRPAALESLPLLKLWPEDGGHFVTLPLVQTRHPELGEPNLGMYRMQRYDDGTTGIHWQIGKGGGFHYHIAEQKGEALPLTCTLGGPPALVLAAIAPLPEDVPEILLAGLLLGERLPLCRNPLEKEGIPLFAEAEFTLIGHVPPKERRPEGPFGDHYGYYSLEHDYPVFHCDAVARRRDAIFPATVVGKPRQEDFYIGDYLQELLSPIFPLVMPTVRDLWSYGETGFHSLAAAVVKDRYGREALTSAFRILGEGQLSLTKFLLVTDTPMDLRNFPKVLEHILARSRFETDLYIFSHTAMDTLDYAGPEVNKGSKGVLLGLGEPIRELPCEWSGEPPPGARDPRVFCPGALVIGGPSYDEDKNYASGLAGAAQLKDWPLVILCDQPEQAAASSINFLWTAFTRFEPANDIHPGEREPVGARLCYSSPIVIDARMKPWYPKEVFAAPEISRRVEERWFEYFPEKNVEMGSSDLGHLAPSNNPRA